MACNCGKRKPKPRPGQQTTQKPLSEAERLRLAQQQGGGKQSYALQTRSGRVLTFGSKLEADAANARTGFTGTVRPA